jgi:hypothetical protein
MPTVTATDLGAPRAQPAASRTLAKPLAPIDGLPAGYGIPLGFERGVEFAF